MTKTFLKIKKVLFYFEFDFVDKNIKNSFVVWSNQVIHGT